ncbi:nucleoside phosphorylase domain-containing protein [Microdochium bolleyi]|uniref:Nucleoside phosphorylase domain-containing protein n=1 Tax=Microdochium bolleyi TaxID=196109 RepID=A0A136IYG8_9PEZI|nr:nucleoside phosphorylase domain-containing protein [Microdochium bolleyi]
MPLYPDLDPSLYTVIWIAPLEVEAQAAIYMLDNKHNGRFAGTHGASHVFEAGDINGHNVVIASLAEDQEYGNSSASNLVTEAKLRFERLRLYLLVGVAAGLPDLESDPPLDIRLGDVLVATSGGRGRAALVAYSLVKETKHGPELLRQGHVLQEPTRLLMSAIGSIKRNAIYGPGDFIDIYKDSIAGKSHSNGTFHDPGQDVDILHTVDRRGREVVQKRAPRRDDSRTRVWYGQIGTGDTLMKEVRARDALRGRLKDDKIIGLEMEAAGVMNVLNAAVIRGVCDYADEHKNKEWQPFAAAMAASYAKAVLWQLGKGLDRPPPQQTR